MNDEAIIFVSLITAAISLIITYHIIKAAVKNAMRRHSQQTVALLKAILVQMGGSVDNAKTDDDRILEINRLLYKTEQDLKRKAITKDEAKKMQRDLLRERKIIES